MAKKSEPQRKPRLGATWVAGTTAVVALSPVTDEVANSIQARQWNTLPQNLRSKATVATAGHLVLTAVDAALDAKFGHAAALSRGSLTAWGGELVRLGAAFKGGGVSIGGAGTVDPRAAHAAFVEATTSYNPSSGTLNPGSQGFWAYQGAKRVGQVLRKASNSRIGQRVFTPVKKTLGAMGVSF